MSGSLFFTKKGKGSPLVLLHPVGMDHSFWGRLVDDAAELHTVLAVDLAGHGKSFLPDDAERGIGAYADDIRDLLDQQGFASAGVLGLSFGGMIAQTLALRHPDRVAFMIAGACGPRIPEEARKAVRERGVLPAGGMAATLQGTLDRWFTQPFMNDPEVERVRQRLLSDDPKGWAAGWNAISGFDALSRLGSIKVPVLIVAGEKDLGTAPVATRAIADAIPGAQFVLLPGAPHMMQIECPEPFSKTVMAFLRKMAK